MPEYDWMSEASFREEVRTAVSNAAAEGGMTQYQTAIVDRLMTLLSENKTLLMEQELVKTASMRKTKSDAIASVDVLVKRASEIAAQARRSLVETRDFEAAYAEKFCMVWPFCGKRK